MRHFFTNNRLFSVLPLVIAGLLCCFCSVQTNYAQSPSPTPIIWEGELTLEYLSGKLRSPKFTQEKRNQIIAAALKTRDGKLKTLQFVLGEDEEQQLREAGANDFLIAALRKSSAQIENTSFGFIYLGNKYLKRGKEARDKAQDLIKKARENRRNGNNDEAVRNEEESRRYEQQVQTNGELAVSNFKQAVGLEPDNTTALNNLASAYELIKRYDDAIEYLTRVITLEPAAVQRYINRAAVYENRGLANPNMDERRADYFRAIADYTKAIEIEPNYGGAYKRRADAYKFYGRTSEYEADMRKFEELKNRPNQ